MRRRRRKGQVRLAQEERERQVEDEALITVLGRDEQEHGWEVTGRRRVTTVRHDRHSERDETGAMQGAGGRDVVGQVVMQSRVTSQAQGE